MWGVEAQMHSFLTLAEHGRDGELHTSVALPPEKNPGTHSIGGWVVPRASMDVLDKG
jgi:hypothetical protein